MACQVSVASRAKEVTWDLLDHVDPLVVEEVLDPRVRLEILVMLGETDWMVYLENAVYLAVLVTLTMVNPEVWVQLDVMVPRVILALLDLTGLMGYLEVGEIQADLTAEDTTVPREKLVMWDPEADQELSELHPVLLTVIQVHQVTQEELESLVYPVERFATI